MTNGPMTNDAMIQKVSKGRSQSSWPSLPLRAGTPSLRLHWDLVIPWSLVIEAWSFIGSLVIGHWSFIESCRSLNLMKTSFLLLSLLLALPARSADDLNATLQK